MGLRSPMPPTTELRYQGVSYIKGDLSLLYSMNKFVTNKSKLPQYGAQVFPYMG